VRKVFVEDARLDLVGDLRGEQAGFDLAEGAQAERREPERHEQGEGGAENGEDADWKQDAFAADAQGGEGDDFAVHGHAAEAEEDADEHGHGEGEDEDAGENGEEKFEDLRAGAGVADEELHKTNEFGYEEDEGEDQESEERVTEDFADNIAIEDAHEAKGECNMGGRAGKKADSR